MSELSPVTSSGAPDKIDIRNLEYTIGPHRLISGFECDIDLEGKLIVMGPNGAGKSIFLRLLAGLLEPTGGSIRFIRSSDGRPFDPSIGMVFQKPVLLRRTTRANIEFVLRGKHFSSSRRNALIERVLKAAHLQHRENISARRLSGGEQQRLALARALVDPPDLLLLDEVTANLDPASTHIVEKMINEASENGTKIMFITHNVRQAKRLADKILFVHNGQNFAYKPTREFFAEPGSRQAQDYLDGKVSSD